MPFQKGNKLGKRGARPGTGRKPKEVKANLEKAQEIARDYIAKHVQPMLDTYFALAAGQIVKRETPDGKHEFTLSVDPATTRHAIDKLMPAAKQQIELSGGIQIVEVKTNVQR